MHSVSKYKALLELYLYLAVPSEWPSFSLCTEVFSEVFCGCGTFVLRVAIVIEFELVENCQGSEREPNIEVPRRERISPLIVVTNLSPRTRDRKRK